MSIGALTFRRSYTNCLHLYMSKLHVSLVFLTLFPASYVTDPVAPVLLVWAFVQVERAVGVIGEQKDTA